MVEGVGARIAAVAYYAPDKETMRLLHELGERFLDRQMHSIGSRLPKHHIAMPIAYTTGRGLFGKVGKVCD